MSNRHKPTVPADSRARAPRPTLNELAQPCGRCAHPNGGHVGGASRSGWSIFDPIWAAAAGWCTVPACDCPARTNEVTAKFTAAIPEVPASVASTRTVATRLMGPCGQGTGPCGRTPTHPYAQGPRCATHAPTAITGSRPWRVLATGSRHHRDQPLIWSTFDAIHAAHPDMLVIHGACYPRPNGRGDRPGVSADWLIHLWCEARGVPDEPHPADWNLYGDDAGKLRNTEMVDLGADECVGFPVGRSPGTWDCLRKAKAAGIPARPVRPGGRDPGPRGRAVGQDSLFEVVA